MKTKIILTLLLLILTSNTQAQEISYYSNFTSYKRLVNDTWTDWTDWKESYTSITIDSSNITISDNIYTIIGIGKHKDDYSETIIYLTKDSNNKYVTIRLRYQNDGIKQLYVDCETLITVYNLM